MSRLYIQMDKEKLNSLSNQELYDRCCRKDQAAWTYLYNYILGITRWSRWNLGHQSEDIAQSVLLTLINNGLQSVKNKDAFRAFVKRITVNRILDHFKRKEGIPISPEGVVLDKTGQNPRKPLAGSSAFIENRIHSNNALEIILKILRELPEYCRRVIKAYMAYQTGRLRSYQDMADKLNLSISTVGVQIRRCKRKIMKDGRFAGLLD